MTAVREARPDERATVANVLDGAALAVDHETLPARIGAGDVLIAHEGGRLLGALVLDSESDSGSGTGSTTRRIDAIAVRRRRRGQGIGSALVAAALERCDRLVAEFDGAELPFYERRGFALEPVGDDRYRGVCRAGEGRPP